jgi:hypothetical protein
MKIVNSGFSLKMKEESKNKFYLGEGLILVNGVLRRR